MRQVHEIIVVEGKYDKNTVAQVVDATIIETSGFGIFSDKDKIALLRKLAEKRGLIILMDSDGAGFFIRGRLRGMLGGADIRHAYIPDVDGRERRKATPSKEGKLGVEGMSPEIILAALRQAGATFIERPDESADPGNPCESADPGDAFPRRDLPAITKADMFAAGLSGGKGSALKRRELAKGLDLPERLSANGLLDVLNALYSREEFYELTLPSSK